MQSLLEKPDTDPTSTDPTGLTFSVLESFEEAEPFRGVWNEVVLRSGADVYQTFEWCSTWWKHYGARRKLRLVLCFSGGELCGMIPAFVETLWLGFARIRVAKLAGSDFSLQFCNLAVMPEMLDDAVSEAVRILLGDERCDLAVFGPLSGPSARIDEILAAGRENDLVGTAESLGNSISTRFDFPGSYEEYQGVIGSRQRGNYSRSVKQFEKSHQVVVDTVSKPDEVVREFEEFQAIHKIQWTAEGKLGHFGDWPGAADFNRDLVQNLGKPGMVRFFRILADGQTASSQYCFVFGGTNYWRLPGRECKPEWEKLSLGKMGLIRMIESSMAEGVRAVEGGRGHYDYKLQLGGCEWPLRTVQFTRRGAAVQLRVKLFRKTAELLNLAYYKVLFLKLVPRFPMLKRPLWSLWIRSTW